MNERCPWPECGGRDRHHFLKPSVMWPERMADYETAAELLRECVTILKMHGGDGPLIKESRAALARLESVAAA